MNNGYCLFKLNMSSKEKIEKIRGLKIGMWTVLLLENGSNIKGTISEVNGRIFMKKFSFKKEGGKIKASSEILGIEFKEVRQVGTNSKKYKNDYKCFFKAILKN